MPPKRGVRRKRGKELVEALRDDESSPACEAAISPDYLETVLSELQSESDRRVKKLKRCMGDMRQEFLNAFQVELLKIPRKVREVPVAHFSGEFGGSIDVALKEAAALKFATKAPQSVVANKSLNRTAATPSVARQGVSATPGASRRMREGECIMSVNGSPLAAVPLSTAKLAATIKVKQGGRSRLPADANLLVELPTGDGGCVSLSEASTIKALHDEPLLKESAIAHLKTLREEIEKVMSALQAQA
ncbi:hypothetical protein M885DRAFT_524510 [Pelagophyceae sp. CCMP2097]|nr:hypothetical protein M885DRAFT_524510 [Pelagophyceae sp. CCMP2097]